MGHGSRRHRRRRHRKLEEELREEVEERGWWRSGEVVEVDDEG